MYYVLDKLSRVMRKPTMWFPIASDNSRTLIKAQKIGKRLQILDLESGRM